MIKVFHYLERDIDCMKFNHWCRRLKSAKNLRRIKSYLHNEHAYTLWDERPIAILGFHEYDKGKYDGCIIADVEFGKNPKHAIKMKKLIEQVIKEYKMQRVQTTSEDSAELNKWHEFLGFKAEENTVIKGVNFIKWGMQWD